MMESYGAVFVRAGMLTHDEWNGVRQTMRRETLWSLAQPVFPHTGVAPLPCSPATPPSSPVVIAGTRTPVAEHDHTHRDGRVSRTSGFMDCATRDQAPHQRHRVEADDDVVMASPSCCRKHRCFQCGQTWGEEQQQPFAGGGDPGGVSEDLVDEDDAYAMVNQALADMLMKDQSLAVDGAESPLAPQKGALFLHSSPSPSVPRDSRREGLLSSLPPLSERAMRRIREVDGDPFCDRAFLDEDDPPPLTPMSSATPVEKERAESPSMSPNPRQPPGSPPPDSPSTSWARQDEKEEGRRTGLLCGKECQDNAWYVSV